MVAVAKYADVFGEKGFLLAHDSRFSSALLGNQGKDLKKLVTPHASEE